MSGTKTEKNKIGEIFFTLISKIFEKKFVEKREGSGDPHPSKLFLVQN